MTKRDFTPLMVILLAIAIAGFAYVDPKHFAKLKDWQTFLASMLALGAATIAYRGAMAKVNFDERIAAQNERRKLRGVLLRLDFALDTLKYEADEILDGLKIPASPSNNTALEVDDVSLSDLPELKEAWENLDLFSADLTQSVYNTQNEIYNFKQYKIDHAGEKHPIEHGMELPKNAEYLRTILADLSASCDKGLVQTNAELLKIRPPSS